MEKLKDFLSGNKRKFITVIGILMAIIFVAGAGIYLKNMSGEKAYHYENKMEAMLAQRTIDYLDQHIVMKQKDLEEMGDTAVKTYNTILSSGINEITDEHSLAIEETINNALHSFLEDENLADADYEVLAAGISKIILDILLTELINSELAINVNYKEEFNELTSSLQTQIRDIEERMEKLKVNATIRFNTDELQADINQAITSSLEKSKNDIYENLNSEINHTVEKQLTEAQRDLANSISQNIDGVKNDITRDVINEVKNQVTGKTGNTGATGPAGPAGKDGSAGKDGAAGKDGVDGKTTYIAYADDALGNGFSLTPTATSKYIGTCITAETTQPTDPKRYSNWQLTGRDGADGKDGAAGKDGADGKDGAAGKDGADGKTTYIAYADDAKGTGFSLTPTETSKYVGTCITDAATQPKEADQYSNWQEYRSYIMTVTTDEHGESTLHIR